MARWFQERDTRVLSFQRDAWRHIAAGQSGLIHAPTGSGKTLAAWIGALLAHARPGAETPPLTVVWVTPLRALAADTHASLTAPLAALGIDWTIGLRTGDTTAGERARQRRRLPSALVTTPESLSLLLSYADTAAAFAHARMVVVDEWHELIGSKRGVQLELCLAHLRRQSPKLATWGLSATLGNIEQAAAVLLGPHREASIVRGEAEKQTCIRTLIPRPPERLPWAGHTGLAAICEVATVLRAARSTLVFTNTRSQAERWFESLMREMPDWLGLIAIHHGSIDATIRHEIERRLSAGELRAVVATSSLDLGVDFAPVEQVIQIGSPKGIARLIQRAGRSGHRPGGVSEIFCVPTNALQLMEIAAAREGAAEGRIEAREPLERCLDVLAQHVVTLALAGGVDAAALYDEVRETHAFAALDDDEWRWVLDFLVTGGPALTAYPDYQRVVRVGDRLSVPSRRIAQRHRMAIGTITADSAMQVRFVGGGYLGTVEEAVIARLKPSDTFLFAGRRLELVRVRDMTAYVRLASRQRAIVPRWSGGRLPLSAELGDALLEQFARVRRGSATAPEIVLLAPLLETQQRLSVLPTPGQLLIERCRSRGGISIFVYPFAGRLVHEGLAALVAWRLSRETPATFSIAANDYGFELLSRTEVPFEPALFASALSVSRLESDVLEAVHATEMARRQFRDIARIAGLVFQGYPGARKAARQIQASSGLIYDVLIRYDPNNRLPRQALDEVLHAQFEIARLRQTLTGIHPRALQLLDTRSLTPLAFPLWADRQSARLSSESWQTRIEAMRDAIERAAQRKRRRRKSA